MLCQRCQCPLGLVPHFYVDVIAVFNGVSECQCPLGLIPHFYPHPSVAEKIVCSSVNALSGLCLISTTS